jgi:hypothetical protein
MASMGPEGIGQLRPTGGPELFTTGAGVDALGVGAASFFSLREQAPNTRSETRQITEQFCRMTNPVAGLT